MSLCGRTAGFDASIAGDRTTEENCEANKGHINGGVSGDNRAPFSALDRRGPLTKIGYNINEDDRIESSRSQEQARGTRTSRERFDDFARDPAPCRTYI